MSRFVLVLLFACTPALAQNFTQSCQSPSFPDPQSKPINSSCGVQGSGGAEANQNMAKNNFCVKDPAEPITFEKMNQLQQDVKSDGTIVFGDTDAPKPHGPQVSRTKLEHLGEGKLVVLKGFVKNARQEGAETMMLDSLDVELAPAGFTYTLAITNTGPQPVTFEARYGFVVF